MTELPFLAEFEEAIRSGRKTATSRPRRYGQAGDIVKTRFGYVRIRSCTRMSLAEIRDRHWREEGCSSPEQFEAVWRRLHPRSGFVPWHRVWFHRFELLEAREVSPA